jgi:hypothetical protein
MSTKNPDFDKLHLAGLSGMGGFHGGDAEVAEDLGIPMSPESLGSHIEAGRQVGALLASHDELPSPALTAHQEWVNSFHLSHPSREFDKVPRKSAEEQSATSANIEAVRSQIHPLGERPAGPAA